MIVAHNYAGRGFLFLYSLNTILARCRARAHTCLSRAHPTQPSQAGEQSVLHCKPRMYTSMYVHASIKAVVCATSVWLWERVIHVRGEAQPSEYAEYGGLRGIE